MCPVCVATAVMVAAGVAGTGSIGTAVSAVLLRKRPAAEHEQRDSMNQVKEGCNGDERDGRA